MTDRPPDAMALDRAFEINSMVVGAWMVRSGFSDDAVPDLSQVTLAEAIQASGIVAAAPPTPRPQGGVTLTCHVEPSRIPHLYAWAIATTELQRICREHAHD